MIRDLVQEFLVAKKADGLTAGSLGKYSFYLARWLEWCEARQLTEPGQLTRAGLRAWAADIQGDGRGRATIKTVIACVRTFVNWAIDERQAAEELAGVLKTPKVVATIQRTLTPSEVSALLRTCEADDTLFGLRDLAIVSLMIDSGLRASELCGLQLEDVHFLPAGSHVMPVRKGGHRQPGYFSSLTQERLERWIEARACYAGSKGPLFVALGGNTPFAQLTRSGLLLLIRRRCKDAQIAPASPHALRRTFACLADEAGASTRKIQVWGGWSDIQMVERYTAAIRAGRLFEGKSPVKFVEGQQGEA